MQANYDHIHLVIKDNELEKMMILMLSVFSRTKLVELEQNTLLEDRVIKKHCSF